MAEVFDDGWRYEWPQSKQRHYTEEELDEIWKNNHDPEDPYRPSARRTYGKNSSGERRRRR